ncbi:hypothetical protein IC007_0545 [Sulfuracidifex tepidarius]|uniref:Uncharacterized protein n=1 Tax=Sulfuracidifex tepidarius TaxID=1294262 RepID=A0A510E1L1_9CREN|nr:hypothetical protein IC007_0545 [Sulfuracidifex tepidarius]
MEGIPLTTVYSYVRRAGMRAYVDLSALQDNSRGSRLHVSFGRELDLRPREVWT